MVLIQIIIRPDILSLLIWVQAVCKDYQQTTEVAAGRERTSLFLNTLFDLNSAGARWLSGRVLDSRPRGRGVEPHRRHCVVVLEQDTFILA